MDISFLLRPANKTVQTSRLHGFFLLLRDKKLVFGAAASPLRGSRAHWPKNSRLPRWQAKKWEVFRLPASGMHRGRAASAPRGGARAKYVCETAEYRV